MRLPDTSIYELWYSGDRHGMGASYLHKESLGCFDHTFVELRHADSFGVESKEWRATTTGV